MKISFDFDGTLSKPSVQEYAKELVDKGFEVWIVTRRFESTEMYTKEFIDNYGILNLEEDHDYLFEVAEKCGIPKERIHFCNMLDKWLFFEGNKDFIWHLDDDSFEVNTINQYTKTICIMVFGTNTWRRKCNKLLGL